MRTFPDYLGCTLTLHYIAYPHVLVNPLPVVAFWLTPVGPFWRCPCRIATFGFPTAPVYLHCPWQYTWFLVSMQVCPLNVPHIHPSRITHCCILCIYLPHPFFLYAFVSSPSWFHGPATHILPWIPSPCPYPTYAAFLGLLHTATPLCSCEILPTPWIPRSYTLQPIYMKPLPVQFHTATQQCQTTASITPHTQLVPSPTAVPPFLGCTHRFTCLPIPTCSCSH